MRETRKGIKDPSTFDDLAKQLKRADKPSESATPPKNVGKSIESISGQTTGNLLDQVLEETHAKAPETESSRGTSEWDNFLNQIVKPHLVPDIEPQQAEMLNAVDAATTELMQRILHHPYKEEDESRVKPCAEIVLTERAAEIILDKGIIPLLCFRNQDIIRLARF